MSSDSGRSRNGIGRCKNVVSIEEKEDRISELPDPIILHILSYLGAQDVVRSGVLSKRFFNLWTDVPCLHFKKVFLEDVNSTLLLHKLSSLEKFSVIDPVGRSYMEFERLIELLNSSNVKDVTFGLESYKLSPECLYSLPAINKLRLEACCIMTGVLVNWKSLQSLCFNFVGIDDCNIKNILSGCPSLVLVELSRCYGFTLIDLTDHNLKQLVIKRYGPAFPMYHLKIFAPNLQSLVLLGKMQLCECEFQNVGSVIDCRLDFDVTDLVKGERILTSLFKALSHVEVVTIGDWFLRVLSVIELKGLPCPMSKSVKCLKLESLEVVRIPGIVCLLQCLNYLEKLVIDVHQLRLHSGACDQDFGDWMSEYIKPRFDLNLKTVKIFGVIASRDLCDRNGVLLLIKLLLKNAKIVEDVTVGASGSKRKLEKLTETLQNFPRSSPRAAIKIVELKWE